MAKSLNIFHKTYIQNDNFFHARINKISDPYMVSSPSQVDAYWFIFMPLLWNYELKPKSQKNKAIT